MTSHSALDASTPNVTESDDVAMFPPSFSQELLWLLDRAQPGNASYNVPRTRRLVGPLDAVALRRAFDALLARHEVLRTTYGFHDDHPVQVIHAPRPADFEVVDLAALGTAEREAEVARLTREAAAQPFDLARELPLRVRLYRLGGEEHVLLIASHHICFDGWSRDVMLRELRALYEAYAAGREPELAALPIQYADFAIWQRQELQGEKLARLLDYWRGELGDASYVLELPTDFPRSAKPGTDGVTRTVVFAPATVQELKRLAGSADATLYMLLLAAYQTVLHRITGQPDILVGSPIAGRSQSQTEGLIGYFANVIVQRGRFAADPTFRALLAQVRESALGNYDHQDVPFEKLVLEIQGAQQLTHSPIYQVVFTQLESTATTFARLGDAEVRPFGLESNETKFDLTLFMAERPNGELELALRARTDLFRPETVEAIVGRIRAVLEAAIANADVRVSQIPLLSVDERARLAAWNDTAVDEGAPATLVELFEAQAARVASRAAIVAPRAGATAQGSVAGAQVLTYAELDARANQLAARLRTLGVAPDVPVGLLLDRSADAVVGLLGILKAGGAYMPLSVDAPPARLAAQLQESGAPVVVTDAAGAAKVPPNVAVVRLDDEQVSTDDTDDTDNAASASSASSASSVDRSAEQLAYVLYTSGSTGTPKGVAVTHANAVHYARAVSRVLADVPSDVAGDGLAAMDGWQFGMASTLAADLGNTALLPALLAGGTLHVLGKDVTTEPARFAEYVAVHPLDALKITPNHLVALTAGRTGADLAPLLPRRWVITGGEALRLDVARTLLGANRCRVLNHYGPTETTVGVLTNEVTAASLAAAEAMGATTVPLGRPLANTHAYVVDAALNEQPVAVPGELLLGGAGVARGYLKRDDLTAERFVEFDVDPGFRRGDDQAAARHPGESRGDDQDAVDPGFRRGDDQDAARHPGEDRGGDQDAARHPGEGRDPRPTSERVYRTGDRVRRLADGTIEFLGRADDQVKVRGYRVELGEIEQVLRAHPGVDAAVAVLRTDDGDAQLVAYVVPKQAGYAVSHSDRATSEKLADWVAAQVPEYMVPNAIVLLDALPLTPNGKVDKRALPAPDATATTAADAFVAPRTETETQLAKIWQDVLKKERVGVTDSFLELGGHSLLAIRVLGRISKAFGVRLSLRTLFDAPTVEQLAEVVDVETQLAALDALGAEDSK